MADLISMLSAASGATAEADPNFNQTVLLLHGDGTNGAQNNTFLDSSTNNFTITRNGNTTQGTFSPFSRSSGNLVNAPYDPAVHGGSAYFDNTGDYLTVPSNAAYRIELNSTWTWECWVYPVTLAATDVLTGNTTNASSTGHVFYLANGLLRLVQYGVSDFASTATVLVNQWNHLAAVSNANSLTFYINGATAGTQTWGSGTAGGAMNIGSGYTGADLFNGYMAGLRYVVGSAITPASGGPTQPPTNITNTSLLLNFTNAGIIDNTGKNNLETVGNAQIDTAVKKYGTGSLEFDGNGDFLSIFATAELQLTNTSAFTIEFWVYATTLPSIGGSAFIIRAYNMSSPFQGYGIAFGGNASNTNLQLWNGTAWADIGTVSTTTWTHVAVTYEGSGSTLRYFINGTQQGSATTVPSSINWTGTQFILGARNSDFYFNGYIDDLRITKGVARYTANFTAPTKAFPDQ
jgi:hypothetical protein